MTNLYVIHAERIKQIKKLLSPSLARLLENSNLEWLI